jgi:hypothetical protein
MTSHKLTLSEFLNIKELGAAKVEELLNSEQFQNLKQKIGQEKEAVNLPGSFYKDLLKLMLNKLDNLLNIDIIRDIFAKNWSKHRDLLKYLDLEKYPPEIPFVFALAKHSLTTEHTPAIEPSLAGKPLGKLEFKVEVEFVIKGVILEVCNAKIMKICLSNLEGTGTLSFAGLSFLETERSIELPGVFDLEEGVPIEAASEQADSALAAENPELQAQAWKDNQWHPNDISI